MQSGQDIRVEKEGGIMAEDNRPKAHDEKLRDDLILAMKRLGHEPLLLADGLDGALIGVGTRFTHPVAVYDYATCVKMVASTYLDEALEINRKGYTDQDAIIDAVEYLDNNTTGAHVGESTPVYLRFSVSELEHITGDRDGR